MTKDKAAQTLGAKGGKARAAAMTATQRSVAAKAAADARWAKRRAEQAETVEPTP